MNYGLFHSVRWEHKLFLGFCDLCVLLLLGGSIHSLREFPHMQKTRWKHRWTRRELYPQCSLLARVWMWESIITLDLLWLLALCPQLRKMAGLDWFLSLCTEAWNTWRQEAGEIVGGTLSLLSGTTALPCLKTNVLKIVLYLYNIL